MSKPDYFVYNAGPVKLDSDFHGIKYDFNYGARLSIPKKEDVHVKITDVGTMTVLCDAYTKDMLKNIEDDPEKEDIVVSVDRKFFIEYQIEIWAGEDYKEYWKHEFNLKDQIVVIRLADGVIGDNLAWFGYAEEFRKKHGCTLYCSIDERLADMLKPNYPDITFIKTNEDVVGCYASYYMGLFFPCDDRNHQPVDFRYVGIQRTASYILGLKDEEVRTIIKPQKERQIKEKYVCISAQSSTACKNWNNPAGWIETIAYLKEQGYRVLCIDRDMVYGSGRSNMQIPYGCENFTGDIPLSERAELLAHADFFIGVSSGLTWLAYCVGCPVIMIGGFTIPINEFYTPYRVINYNGCTGCWNYHEFSHDNYSFCPEHEHTDREFECSRIISSGHVIKTIKQLMKDYSLCENAGKE